MPEARRVTKKVCKDCGNKRRQASKPGPRCATCWRIETRNRTSTRRATHVEKTYSITEEEYQELLAAQGGHCYVCPRKPGKYRLAVDHDHTCCPGSVSCGKCVRALLCKNCNRNVLGRLRDSVEALERAIEVLTTHPAQQVLTRLRGDING